MSKKKRTNFSTISLYNEAAYTALKNYFKASIGELVEERKINKNDVLMQLCRLQSVLEAITMLYNTGSRESQNSSVGRAQSTLHFLALESSEKCKEMLKKMK